MTDDAPGSGPDAPIGDGSGSRNDPRDGAATPRDGADYPGDSLWQATTPRTDYEPLDGGLHVDVAVVGGGITGLTAAIELQETGRDVAVIEAGRIVERTTGKTTAKITSQHGRCYDQLRSKHGRTAARQYARANEAAIDAIEERVEELDVDCDFERRPNYVYPESAADVSALREEARAAMELGLPAEYVESTDLPFDVPGAVRFDDQAQFHPRKYLLGVAEAIVEDGGHVFEQTRALDVDDGRQCRVETTRGDVVADDVVVASHFPFYDEAGYFARLHPRRAYLLAVRIAGDAPEGMYYRTGEHSRTIRQQPAEGGELLLVGGETHRPGEGASPAERYRRCELFARDRFDVESVEHRWSTHDHWSVDDVPYIGLVGPGTDDVYVGTGFGGWGMTGGTAAGTILAQLIDEGEHPYADAFDPLRVTPRASARELVTAAAKNAVQLAGKRAGAFLTPEDRPPVGEATVVHDDGRTIGVYRDEDGELHAVSASCSHMGCVVEWNDAERTWDCPCHGSRFTYDGDVVSGPALEGLDHLEL